VSRSNMVPWLIRSGDNSRSGWNQHETILTQASVESKGIARATIIPVFGDARGMEAQPLILPNVKLRDGSIHDVMVLPSMGNIVRGVDASPGEALWVISAGYEILPAGFTRSGQWVSPTLTSLKVRWAIPPPLGPRLYARTVAAGGAQEATSPI
jgi:hypothetical protein